MKLATKHEIFCYGFPCRDCPFDFHGCMLSYPKDKAVFILAVKSNRFNEYLERAKRLGVKLSGGVVLR